MRATRSSFGHSGVYNSNHVAAAGIGPIDPDRDPAGRVTAPACPGARAYRPRASRGSHCTACPGGTRGIRRPIGCAALATRAEPLGGNWPPPSAGIFQHLCHRLLQHRRRLLWRGAGDRIGGRSARPGPRSPDLAYRARSPLRHRPGRAGKTSQTLRLTPARARAPTARAHAGRPCVLRRSNHANFPCTYARAG